MPIKSLPICLFLCIWTSSKGEQYPHLSQRRGQPPAARVQQRITFAREIVPVAHEAVAHGNQIRMRAHKGIALLNQISVSDSDSIAFGNQIAVSPRGGVAFGYQLARHA